jgi:hypothetical protein
MLIHRGLARDGHRSSDRMRLGSLMNNGDPMRASGWMFEGRVVPGQDWPKQ